MAAQGGGGRRSTPPGPSGKKMPGKVGVPRRPSQPPTRPSGGKKRK